MEQRVIACSCGRRFEVFLGPTVESKVCSRCGAVIHIPAASPLGTPPPPAPARDLAEAVAQSEISLFFDDSAEPVVPQGGPAKPAFTTLRTEASAQPAVTREPTHEATCTRCGKPFRGDWDRVDTDTGHFCHICANQAQGAPAKRPTPPPVPPSWESKVYKAGSWVALNEQTGEGQIEAEIADGDRRRFEMKVFAVIVVATFALMYFFMPSGDESDSEAVLSVPRELPALVVLGLAILDVVLSLGAYATALFLTLREAGRIPKDEILPYVPTALVGGIPIWVALIISGMATNLMSMVPLAGMLAPLVVFGSLVYVLYFTLNLDMTDCFYFVVYLAVCKLLFWAVRALVAGMVANAFA